MSLGAPLSLADGLSAIGADAWHQAGYTGQGVKVGILDLGFAGYQELLGTALPAEIVGRAFGASAELGESGQPHGTACAEIVHAVAPGAELYLAAYDASEESMRRAVYWLVAQGVDVITHSATFAVGAMDGSSFQSDLVAYAAKHASSG